MAYSARPTSTNLLTQLVNQVAHGFTVGTPVVFDGANYILAKSDSEVNCFNTVLVSIVIDADNFYFSQTGYVTALEALGGGATSYAPGEPYYLSDTVAGTLNLTPPTTNGHVVLACFLPDTATSGTWFGGSGVIIESGSVFSWTTITSGSPALAINNGYIINKATLAQCLLPTVSTVGDIIRVVNIAVGGWKVVNSNSGMQIFMGNQESTLGVTGYIASTDFGDAVEMLCVAGGANIQWQVISSMGNITIF